MVAAEQPRNRAHLARRDQFAHPRRAYHRAIDRHRPDHDCLETHPLPQFGHHFGVAGVSRLSAGVNAITTTPSIPEAHSSSSLSSGARMRRGAREGASTLAGSGSKVRAKAVPEAARARSIAAFKIARWPRWTPSKLPSATTGWGCGRSWSMSRIISIIQRTLDERRAGCERAGARRAITCYTD